MNMVIQCYLKPCSSVHTYLELTSNNHRLQNVPVYWSEISSRGFGFDNIKRGGCKSVKR